MLLKPSNSESYLAVVARGFWMSVIGARKGRLADTDVYICYAIRMNEHDASLGSYCGIRGSVTCGASGFPALAVHSAIAALTALSLDPGLIGSLLFDLSLLRGYNLCPLHCRLESLEPMAARRRSEGKHAAGDHW